MTRSRFLCEMYYILSFSFVHTNIHAQHIVFSRVVTLSGNIFLIRFLFLCEMNYSRLLSTQHYALVSIFLIKSLFLCGFDCFIDQVSLSECFVLLTVLLLCAHEYTPATHSFFPTHEHTLARHDVSYVLHRTHANTRLCYFPPIFIGPLSTRKFQKILLL